MRILSILISVFFPASVHAISGIFGTGVVIELNGNVTLYEATLLGDGRHQPSGFGPTLNTTGLDGIDLGTFDPSQGETLNLRGGGILTFKNDSDDVTGARVNYEVDSNGFAPLSLTFNEDSVSGISGDQRWYSQSFNIDLLSGLSNGVHTLSVFFDAPFTFDTGSGTHTENNSNNNFVATFTVVPEPSTGMVLVVAGLTFLRRRRS